MYVPSLLITMALLKSLYIISRTYLIISITYSNMKSKLNANTKVNKASNDVTLKLFPFILTFVPM